MSYEPSPESTVLESPDSTDEPRSRGVRERLEFLLFRITQRLKLGVSAAYFAAASLIGVEALAMVLSFATMWPGSIVLVVGGLALVYLLRKRLRASWRRWRSRD